MSKALAIDLIRVDGGTQMRAAIDKDHVAELKAAWEAKADIPALVVFFDGTDYWLGDGFHRWHSAQAAKRGSVPCDIRNGTKRDAILHSCKANQGHGLKRNNADKRNSVATLLNDQEWVTWADNRIADEVGVSQPFVRDVRAQLITVISSPAAQTADQPKIGKDGKARKPRKNKPRKPKKVKTQSDEPAADPEPTVLTDAEGKPVPDFLVDVFGQCKAWEHAMSLVSQAKKAVTEIKDHRAAMHLDVQEVERLLTQTRTNLKFAVPHTECVKCRRKLKSDCTHCKGQGWLNKPTLNSCASDADRAWLEARK